MSIRSTAYARKLEEAGVDPKVARAHAEALEDLVMGDYVMKDYLDARLTALESKLQSQFSQLESTMIRWMSAKASRSSLCFLPSNECSNSGVMMSSTAM